MKVVVVGGVAAGLSAASQIKRQMPEAIVTVYEKSGDVSYGACGMPYNLLFKEKPVESLYAMSYGEIIHKRGVNYKLYHEVEEIDVKKNSVKIRDISNNLTIKDNYDYIVYATGASAVRLPEENFKNVYYFKTLDDLRKVKKLVYGGIKNATLIGAGYINLELADSLSELGIKVKILEKMDYILPFLDSDLRKIVLNTLENNGVELITGVDIYGSDGKSIDSSAGKFEQDLVVAALGVRPNTDMLSNTGVELGIKGAVKVNLFQQTNIENIFSGGDCAEHYNRQTGEFTYMPLGTTANKQGRIAGNNIANIVSMSKFQGILQTAAFKLFDLTVATTGMFESQILGAKIDYDKVVITSHTRGAYPGNGKMTVCLYYDKSNGIVLGGQIVGQDVVAKRIDVISAAVYKNATVFELSELDLSYAPPFAPVWDPILVAANVAVKQMK
ncbi:FAD-dependent oxidoreductase [Deferribacterales bacterium Es71-Z0220]|jgi:NADPH-dependent 2,4-dienoyl-CoA reductase/sulfur reductase-like enzyme|uniref:FAD-dependent oxidoreductase n=1 Tax=Deferrivibrio essentukiensis TaxID=2880922 RepID=UPI001F61C6B7|nr:FAD-dependent oxidoreductase [Deferrivibrio essentukiensis]MCB4205463.1 FAD-dependent oxidoreductase [Deferrivibrio essentukiensis]